MADTRRDRAEAIARNALRRLPARAQEPLRVAQRLLSAPSGAGDTNTAYWSRHNVTSHRRFDTRDESLEYAEWRNAQYLFLEEFMPYAAMRGRTVLDYGSGPGNDLVGIAEWGSPARLIAADVSPVSLEEARRRMRLHPGPVLETVVVDESTADLPIDDASVDVIVSAGVLHHCPNVDDILDELRRILRPDGFVVVMVYNRDSIWAHLYVPFLRQIAAGIDRDRPFDEAFKRSTDGPGCPYSVSYRPDEFTALAERHGFAGTFLGAAVAVDEMKWLGRRFEAIADRRLGAEHRRFLTRLELDRFGRPLHAGHVAGIDAFYRLTRA